jgi:hypothetical protein
MVLSHQVNLLPKTVGLFKKICVHQVNLLPESVGLFKTGVHTSGQSAA